MNRFFLDQLLILLGFLCPILILGQNSSYLIHEKLITQNDGLPLRTVTCGAQDTKGFLWFGTKSGLFRYDGYNFVRFTDINNKLRGKSICEIVPDGKNAFIISYFKAGSSYYKDTIRDVVNTDNFNVDKLASYYSLPFAEKEVTDIDLNGDNLYFTIGKNHVKWVKNKENLFQLIKENIYFRKIKYFFPEEKYTSENISLVTADSLDYAIYVRKDGTISIPTYYGREKTPPTYFELACKLKSGSFIYSKETTSSRQNYFFITKNGLLQNCSELPGLKSISLNDKASPYLRSDNDESFVFTDEAKHVGLYSFTYGKINLFEKLRNKLDQIRIISYFKDVQNNYWFCTSNGLIQMKITEALFETEFSNNERSYEGKNSARGIYASGDTILAALKDNIVINKNGTTLRLNEVGGINYAVAKIDGEFWLGSLSLRKMDSKKKKIEVKVMPVSEDIWSIFRLNDERLLLGCSNGLEVFHKKTNICKPAVMPETIAPKFIYNIFLNKEGLIVLVADNGIYFLDSQLVLKERYAYDEKRRKLPCRSVYDVHQDAKGDYWIASNGDGLIKWDKENKMFKTFTTENGLSSDIIYSALSDKYNNLWVSTHHGICKFNKNNDEVKVFTEKDGISNNEFNRASKFIDSDGNIYFGSIDGITIIDSKKISKLPFREELYPFCITTLSQFNAKKNTLEDVMKPLLLKKGIKMSDNIKYVSLKLALLDYEHWQNEYAYRIEGLDSSWTCSRTNSILLNNLPYGNYILHIKALTSNGSWNKNEIIIPLEVIKPFYKTFWFFAIITFGLIAGVFYFVRYRLRKLKYENLKLETIVNERTNELKRSLREKSAMVQEIHHRVKNNLQFVTAMLELQIDYDLKDEKQNSLLSTTRRINAMTLVHEMLYSKENLESIDVNIYLSEIISEVNKILNESNIPIQFNVHIDSVSFNINNCVAIGMITSELLSNSIKYAFKSMVDPKVNIELKERNGAIAYLYSDNGVGIDDSKNKHGFGFKLIEIFCNQLKGKFKIGGEKGFLFTFEFKYKKQGEQN